MKSENEILKSLENTGVDRRNFLKILGCWGAGLAMGLNGISCDGLETEEELRDPYIPVMDLTETELSILNGEYGLTLQKIMETIVRYGDMFGADRLVPIDGPIHVVGSFGVFFFKPYFSILKELKDKGLKTNAPFTADPRPPMAKDFKDLNMSQCLLDREATVFRVMFSNQKLLENNLSAIGLAGSDAFTCTCYLDEVGNTPTRGQILSWAESSAVSYVNSVIGARTNRNSAVIEIFGGILGKVPNFGLLMDENRSATWEIQVNTSTLPEAQVLGSAIGMKVLEEVPYIVGLDRFLGTEMNDTVKDYFKDMGAAAASNGAVGLYHVENLTPEAVDMGRNLLEPSYQTYVIDDDVIYNTIDSYPTPEPWQEADTTPELCFIGCPHLTLNQLFTWTDEIESALRNAGEETLAIHTVLTTSPQVLNAFQSTSRYETLINTGAKILSICPLSYMGHPLVKGDPVLTNSNKLRTYTTAKYATDAEVLNAIVTGEL